MIKYRQYVSQQSLMCLNACGARMAYQSLWRYLMWLRKLQMRELKMQFREYFRKKRLLIMRMHLEYLQSIHSLRRSAIVLMVFFISLISPMKSSKGTPVKVQTDATTSRYFSIKVMMAFPQFLGMFLVSFLSFFSFISSRSLLSESGVFSSSETPLSWVMTQDFSLKLLGAVYVNCGMMGWQNCMMEESLSSFLMIWLSMLLFQWSWSSCGKMSSSFTSHRRSLWSWSQLWWWWGKLKTDEPSPGFISTETLLIFDSRLSPFIRLICNTICSIIIIFIAPRYQYPPSDLDGRSFHQECRNG